MSSALAGTAKTFPLSKCKVHADCQLVQETLCKTPVAINRSKYAAWKKQDQEAVEAEANSKSVEGIHCNDHYDIGLLKPACEKNLCTWKLKTDL